MRDLFCRVAFSFLIWRICLLISTARSLESVMPFNSSIQRRIWLSASDTTSSFLLASSIGSVMFHLELRNRSLCILYMYFWHDNCLLIRITSQKHCHQTQTNRSLYLCNMPTLPQKTFCLRLGIPPSEYLYRFHSPGKSARIFFCFRCTVPKKYNAYMSYPTSNPPMFSASVSFAQYVPPSFMYFIQSTSIHRILLLGMYKLTSFPSRTDDRQIHCTILDSAYRS